MFFSFACTSDDVQRRILLTGEKANSNITYDKVLFPGEQNSGRSVARELFVVEGACKKYRTVDLIITKHRSARIALALSAVVV